MPRSYSDDGISVPPQLVQVKLGKTTDYLTPECIIYIRELLTYLYIITTGPKQVALGADCTMLQVTSLFLTRICRSYSYAKKGRRNSLRFKVKEAKEKLPGNGNTATQALLG